MPSYSHVLLSPAELARLMVPEAPGDQAVLCWCSETPQPNFNCCHCLCCHCFCCCSAPGSAVTGQELLQIPPSHRLLLCLDGCCCCQPAAALLLPGVSGVHTCCLWAGHCCRLLQAAAVLGQEGKAAQSKHDGSASRHLQRLRCTTTKTMGEDVRRYMYCAVHP